LNLLFLASFFIFNLQAAQTLGSWDWSKVNDLLTCKKSALSNSEDKCGFQLSNAGWWDEVARCTDGLRWSYVLQSIAAETKGRRMLCAGVSSATGFEEIPCSLFTGDLKKFEVVAKTATKCFEGFNQDIKFDFSSHKFGQRVPRIKLLSARESLCSRVSCEGPQCGCRLLASGWTEVARCEGHQWTYLLQKGAQKLMCKGISALAGPREDPCTGFSGDASEFEKCKADSK
jgi:hypothetical protein